MFIFTMVLMVGTTLVMSKCSGIKTDPLLPISPLMLPMLWISVLKIALTTGITIADGIGKLMLSKVNAGNPAFFIFLFPATLAILVFAFPLKAHFLLNGQNVLKP